jgi:hypothetical protein
MKSKELKRKEAEERNKNWSNMSPKDQLAHLDKLGVKATKQRAKLAKKINETQSA